MKKQTKKKSKFPDHSGDGKITKKDILMAKGIFPGDFKNFTESKEFKDSKKAQKDKYEKDKQHPVKGKNAGFQFLMDSGKKEMESFKKYRKNRADTQDKARVNARKGGSIKKKKSSRKALRGGGCEIR